MLANREGEQADLQSIQSTSPSAQVDYARPCGHSKLKFATRDGQAPPCAPAGFDSRRGRIGQPNKNSVLVNDLKFSIVLVCIADAPLALTTDPQMISRFAPFEMPLWRESDDLRRLLGAFERVLPLRKPSDLMQRSIAQFVLFASDGLTGEISRLLTLDRGAWQRVT